LEYLKRIKDSLVLLGRRKYAKVGDSVGAIYKRNKEGYMQKPKVITLCGSTKFKKEFEQVQADLTLQGNIVISCGLFGHTDGLHKLQGKKRNA
jgi:hypothetical protein